MSQPLATHPMRIGQISGQRPDLTADIGHTAMIFHASPLVKEPTANRLSWR